MSTTIRVLHLDDNPFELDGVSKSLSENSLGYSFDVRSVPTVTEFRDALIQQPPDLVLLDLQLGEGELGGTSLMEEIRRESPVAAVIIWSAHDDVSLVAQSLRLGADDFLSKRTDQGELPLRLYRSLELVRLKRGLSVPAADTFSEPTPAAYVGSTMERIGSRIPFVLKSAVSAVHVQGECGTGKEVVADLFESGCRPLPFVRVNCGAITPTLLESELFGYVKGAFTGALSEKKGYFETANGGWIFLDEIASLSLSAQAALLRAGRSSSLLKAAPNVA